MLPRLILLVLQLAIAFFAAPYVKRYIPALGQADIFVWAAIYAALVWLVGMIGSIVLKGVATPSGATLTATLVLALVFAGITLVPDVTKAIASYVKGVQPSMYPLIGAVIGYMIKK
jgi:hypothetical protein